MILNIRGTNGSGKSTIIKTFLQRYPHLEIFGSLGPRRPEAYKVKLPSQLLYVIGPYQTRTGGVDAISGSSSDLIRLLDKYHNLGHIIFEGVIISTFFGEVGDWLVRHKDEARVVFLDTPLEDCLAGIKSRGGKNTKNVASKMPMIQRVRARMIEADVSTFELSREAAFETIKGWL